jgi:hypothetical protein
MHPTCTNSLDRSQAVLGYNLFEFESRNESNSIWSRHKATEDEIEFPLICSMVWYVDVSSFFFPCEPTCRCDI